MTKPADSDQIAKAQEQRINEIFEREKKATKGPYTITGGNYLGIIAVIDGKSSQIGRAEGCGDRVSDEQVEDNARFFAHARADIPFLLSELASERQAVIEDCCRAVCDYCKRPDMYEFFNAETRTHRHFESDLHFHCAATAIRSME